MDLSVFKISWISVFLLIVVSCAPTEPPSTSMDNNILVSASLKESKAETVWSIDGANNTDILLSFGVYAYHNNSVLYMGGATGGTMVSRTDKESEWNYNPFMYWPSQGTVSFYGYAPSSMDPGDINRSTIPPTINFSVDSYAQYQTDLLLAVPQKEKTGVQGIVTMPFRHALTKIVFSARIDDLLAAYADSVRVDEIIVEGIQTRGSHPMDASAGWTIDPDDVFRRRFFLERVPQIMGIQPELETIYLKTSYQMITKKTGILMMLPQRMDDQKRLIVSYTVLAAFTQPISIKDTLSLKDASAEWRQGDALNFQLLIKPDHILLSIFGLPGSPAVQP